MRQFNGEFATDELGAIESELSRLSLRGIVALATRCARRVVGLYVPFRGEHHIKERERLDCIQAAQEAICFAERYCTHKEHASYGKDTIHTLELLDGLAGHACKHTGEAAIAAYGGKHEEVVRLTALVQLYGAAAIRSAAEYAYSYEEAVKTDFNKLLTLSLGEYPNTGGVLNPRESGPLGPMWDELSPEWYSDRREGTSHPRLKGPAPTHSYRQTLHTIRPFHFNMSEEDCRTFVEGCREILRTGRLVLGQHTTQFEQAFAEFVGVKHAIAVNSGSSAIEILLRIKNIAGRTILVPTNTNFATVASVLRAGGKVRLLDMDRSTFAPTLEMVQRAVDEEPDVAGVLWVHIAGIIASRFPEVVNFCHDRGLFVLEDAAHAQGSSLNGRFAGNLADGGAFSFCATKVITTCEGGMVTTNNDQEAQLARSHRNQGIRDQDFGGIHEDFGNSCRMTEINALLGLTQLRRLPEMLQRRARAYSTITSALRDGGVEYVSTEHMDTSSHYKLIVLLPHGAVDVKRALRRRGVLVGGGVYDVPCHRQPVFNSLAKGTFPGAEHWCPNHICPPLTSTMSDRDAARVAESLMKCLKGN